MRLLMSPEVAAVDLMKIVPYLIAATFMENDAKYSKGAEWAL